MIKKKLKPKKATEAEETVVANKLQKTSIKAVKEKKKEDESRRSGNLKYLKIPTGKTLYWIIPPVSEGMNGSPYVDRYIHSNLGSEGNSFGPCMRSNLKRETQNDCICCEKVNTYWNKHREAKKNGKEKIAKKYLEIAKKQGVKTRPLCQVLDVTGAYDKAGHVVDQFPECFGENSGTDEEKHKKCRGCTFLSSCQRGVQLWEMQFTPYTSFIEKIGEEEVDVTNPSAAIPMKIKRTGEGQMDTKYIIEWGDKIKIPDHVVSFVEKHAGALDKLFKPSDLAQMEKMMGVGGETKVEKKNNVEKGEIKNHSKARVSKEQLMKMRDKLKSDSAKKKRVSSDKPF